MVNSTNVKEIKTYENIFISDLEKSFENYYTYKNFGKIYENEYFSTYIILVQMDNPELHYSFSITTVNKSETKMIDSFYLSGYSHDSGELCTGYISKDLLIFKTCDSDNFKINKRINTFGKIVDIN